MKRRMRRDGTYTLSVRRLYGLLAPHARWRNFACSITIVSELSALVTCVANSAMQVRFVLTRGRQSMADTAFWPRYHAFLAAMKPSLAWIPYSKVVKDLEIAVLP